MPQPLKLCYGKENTRSLLDGLILLPLPLVGLNQAVTIRAVCLLRYKPPLWPYFAELQPNNYHVLKVRAGGDEILSS